jgi:hypothetical protein
LRAVVQLTRFNFGIEEQKVAAVWDYQTSPLYSEAERIARRWRTSRSLPARNS